MSAKPIAFIIGAGKNIGAATASHFSQKGYRVAQAARSVNTEDSKDDSLLLKIDLSKPDTVRTAFENIRKTWGEPSVVIYNAASAIFVDATNPFTVPVEDFERENTINVTSVYVAVQEAVASFDELPASTKKAFLYTGNALNTICWPKMWSAGLGKAATAHLMETGSLSYKEKGYGFYYVDERKADGSPKVNPYVSGPAHAEFFAGLVDGSLKAPWHATFVEGKGYQAFAGARE
ncbi:hypothetical protein LTR78_002318 [Recurvomyces mirabilis]|uniref:Uncharacterized protein n=1 Tax=Recurvomyces mirabilis TaxID=574656 RepID=A0AAE0WUT9_9PEZI|nr:hypothetical protein LTR78_002318 [Recurvomyces mirabilis]KAK5160773.1 hypothetical protein LTS14_001786 [Recurvomyces mirabilis]